jgi:hypothetical protein
MNYLETSALLAVYYANTTDMEKHCSEEKANTLMKQLNEVAILVDCYMDLQRLYDKARDRAQSDCDMFPGHFRNWFWYVGKELENYTN